MGLLSTMFWHPVKLQYISTLYIPSGLDKGLGQKLGDKVKGESSDILFITNSIINLYRQFGLVIHDRCQESMSRQDQTMRHIYELTGATGKLISCSTWKSITIPGTTIEIPAEFIRTV